MTQKTIICIVGPTASGKTGAAVALARRVNGEVASADSVQVYRGLDVGSAKPTKEEMRNVPHHLIDCIEVDEPNFSVSKYFELASQAIRDIQSQNKTVIVAGGSGLYINALTRPLNFAAPKDDKIRRTLEAQYDLDADKSFDALMRFDPETAKRIHKNDKKRVVRALEIYMASGKPLSSYGNDFQNERKAEPPFASIRFCLTMERTLLYDRINRRVDCMIENGLVDEARKLFDTGYSMNLPAMQSIGYAQLFQYFNGELTLPEAINQIKRDTRRFSKRQLTWFRRDKDLIWIDTAEYNNHSEKIAQEILRQLIELGMEID